MEESPADYVKENTWLADPDNGERIMQIVRKSFQASGFRKTISWKPFLLSQERDSDLIFDTSITRSASVFASIQVKFHILGILGKAG